MACIGLCEGIHTAPRRITTLIPMEFCKFVIGLVMGVAQCEQTIMPNQRLLSSSISFSTSYIIDVVLLYSWHVLVVYVDNHTVLVIFQSTQIRPSEPIPYQYLTFIFYLLSVYVNWFRCVYDALYFYIKTCKRLCFLTKFIKRTYHEE